MFVSEKEHFDIYSFQLEEQAHVVVSGISPASNVSNNVLDVRRLSAGSYFLSVGAPEEQFAQFIKP